MFGRRRRFMPGRRGTGGLGLFLLGMQLINLFNYFSRQNEYLPVTIGVLAVNLLAYFQPGGHGWPSIQQACISVQKVWFQKEWRRILYAPFFHASDFHLYYNMASFIWKGISLEKHFGSGYFLYLITVFSVATNLVYLGINFALAELLDQWLAMRSCAVGFSGVLFALKVVSTHIQPPGMTRVLGFIPVPMRLACWVELVLISVLFPNVSFVGHLSGILVGLAWVYGPLRMAMDVPLSVVNEMLPAATGGDGEARRHDDGRSYAYRAGATGYRPPEDRGRRTARPTPRPTPTYTSYTYASGSTGHTGDHIGRREGGATDPSVRPPGEAQQQEEEEEELQEAIRQSLEGNGNPSSSSAAPGDRSSTRMGTGGTSEIPPGEIDSELQLTVERSLAETRDHSPLPRPENESFERPPPFNPAFSHSSTDPSTASRDIGFVVADEEDLLSSETVPVGGYDTQQSTSHADSGSGSLRRRGVRTGDSPLDSPSLDSTESHHTGSTANSSQRDSYRRQSGADGPRGQTEGAGLSREGLGLSREELRAARVQRFGSATRQRAPLDSAGRRGSWK